MSSSTADLRVYLVAASADSWPLHGPVLEQAVDAYQAK
ncbi:hypothetical protein J2S91_001847 [Arthrobacter bambusae]|nr:hypothetical protein [Arthrobacter bambusae]